jgi:hypothetical protein
VELMDISNVFIYLCMLVKGKQGYQKEGLNGKLTNSKQSLSSMRMATNRVLAHGHVLQY